MITDRDICMAALMRDRAPSAIPVADVMSRDLQACAPDDNVSAAEQTMRDHQIRRLPIVDRERRLLGVLSLADIVRATGHHKGRGARPVAHEEVAGTLADICATRARDPNPTTSAAF
jgi:CBS-domain-containing membrane protein